jgi:hypothetical protein
LPLASGERVWDRAHRGDLKRRSVKPRRKERPLAGRYYLGQPKKPVRPERRAADLFLARRAVRLLHRFEPLPDGHDYSPTDVLLPTRTRPGVVYIQERYLGLPVYDARRAVVLRTRGRSLVTGKRVDASGLQTLTPARSAEEAVKHAAKLVFRWCPRDALEYLATFPSTERFTRFVWGDLVEPTTHLVVYVVGRARLAWVVEVGSPGGRRYELVLDAKTLRLLKRRVISQHVSAHLSFASGTHDIDFDLAWGPTTWRRVVCKFEDRKVGLPASTGGVMAAGPPPGGLPVAWSLATLTLASAAFELMALSGARLPRSGDTPSARLFGRPEVDPSLAAQAFADQVQLRLLDKGGGGFVHAAEDPTVILHEISHVVLSFNLGGSTFTSPFESFGESGAASEGLADFLGLTLWNRIARDANGAHADDWLMGAVLLPSPRNYASYFQAPPPAAPGTSGIHGEGMRLCAGLLAALHAFALRQSRDLAEETLWSALFAALQQAPHDGPLPLFCCMVTRVLASLPRSFAADADAAFRAVGLPLFCPHPSVPH